MENADQTIELLRAVPGLAAAPRRILAALAPLVDVTDISPGQVLAREGTVGREAFLVVAGEADVYIDGERVATVGRGDFVGETSMLDQRPRSATVRARTAMRALVVGPAAFPTLVQNFQAARSRAVQFSGRARRAETQADAQAREARPTEQAAAFARPTQ